MGFPAAVLGLAAVLSAFVAPEGACAEDSSIQPPSPSEDCCAPLSPRGIDLIVEFEVGGRAVYERRYQRPICPVCESTASGVTIGIGYDLRHQRKATIAKDWRDHPQVAELPQASGIGGRQAIELTRRLQHVITPLPLAEAVFLESSAVEYRHRAERCYPGLGAMPQPVIDAMVSLTYNRGCPTGMTDRGREARIIRDSCIPQRDQQCVAAQLRAMSRIWAGSTIESGMQRRRHAEAKLAEDARP
jgi:GH24 family phage-related lysozyme (muramidase)